jgi:outer membrane protein assembly factor BamB
MTAHVHFLIVLMFSSVVLLSTTNADDWSQFRGPTGDGVSTSPTHTVEWSEDKNIQWKVKVEGVAWSQPIIAGDRVLVTTAVAVGQKSPRVGESGPGFSLFSAQGISRALGGGKAPDTNCQWKLLCLDVTTGDLLWEKLVREGNPSIPIHRSNSYASETPVTDGEHVYVYVTMAGIFCFDMKGNEVWKQALPPSPMQFGPRTPGNPGAGGGRSEPAAEN